MRDTLQGGFGSHLAVRNKNVGAGMREFH
jgi:hypothetical protein